MQFIAVPSLLLSKLYIVLTSAGGYIVASYERAPKCSPRDALGGPHAAYGGRFELGSPRYPCRGRGAASNAGSRDPQAAARVSRGIVRIRRGATCTNLG